MKKGSLLLLVVLVSAFGACKKRREANYIEQLQQLMAGTYDVNCETIIYNATIDSGLTWRYTYDTLVWEISIVDNRHILWKGNEYEIDLDDNATSLPDQYVITTGLTFILPDSLIYHSNYPGHLPPHVTCTGKKR